MIDVSLPSGIAAAEAADSFAAQREIAARLERIPLTWTRIKARIVVGTAAEIRRF